MSKKYHHKFSIKPKKLTIEIDGEKEEFYAKPVSYNLAIAITQNHIETIRQLAVLKYCLCNEDGQMVFDEKCPLEEVGDMFEYEYISKMSTAIVNASGPQQRIDNIKKKQGN